MQTNLTEREQTVLELFAQQKSNGEIARELVLSVGTVKWYAQQIFNKLGVSNRKDAVVQGKATGLLGRVNDSAETAVPHNLPAQLTSFVGRTDEVVQIRELLTQTRLLTLTGPGGVGKTRLAIQTASTLFHQYPDGIYWVGLFSISDPDLIINAIAEALGVYEADGKSLQTAVHQYLKRRQLLLILDNYEHLMAGNDWVPTLLTAAPNLHIIVTSREVLHVIGEQEYLVAPLPLPTIDVSVTLKAFSQHPALLLFVQRVQATNPNFVVNEENLPNIIEICRRLDGLPLALELAAARSKLFTPKALLDRLDARLSTLSTPLLDASGRRQTLRQTISWSYELLDESEQQLFCRLSAFAGGWSLVALDAVCPDMQPEDVLNGLSSLLDKSLIRQELNEEGEPRFWMLHVLREYALEQLVQQEEARTVFERHATYYLSVAKTALPKLHGIQQIEWLERLEKDHDNFRVALDYFFQNKKKDELLQIVAALGWFWIKQDHYSEGYRWATRALELGHDADPERRVKVILFAAARLAYMLRRMNEVKPLLVEALAWAEAKQDLYHQGWTYGFLGLYQEVVAENRAQTVHLLEKATDCFYRSKVEDFGLAWILNGLGVVYTLEGNFPKAVHSLEASLEVARRVGNLWVEQLDLMNLGMIAYQSGDFAKAHRLFFERLDVIKTSKRLYYYANWLFCIGLICEAAGQSETAVMLLSGVSKLFSTTPVTLSYPYDAYYAASLAKLKESVPSDQFDQWWGQAQRATLDQMMAWATAVEIS